MLAFCMTISMFVLDVSAAEEPTRIDEDCARVVEAYDYDVAIGYINDKDETTYPNGHVKIAVCGAIVNEKTEPQLLPEEHAVLKTLGVQPYERETSFLVDGNSNAKVLTIGECYVTPGNWAGFPPHKHDEDNMPTECIAEEIYYFLFDPEQGCGVKCVYTSDGSVDEAYRVRNDELVEFPYGYHTTVSTPGYQTYFLWLMAGDYQGFNRSNDPEHAWIAG